MKVSGYAASGGGRGIERIDVSVDGGKTWVEASRHQKTGVPYIAEDTSSDKWAWVLFEVTVDVPHSTEIVAKAVCTFITIVFVVILFYTLISSNSSIAFDAYLEICMFVHDLYDF